MARYIDEKDVYRLVEPTGTARVHCSQIDELPRADVVPKSEVEKIFKEFERLMENNEVWFRQTDEIREEFAKLKKKYTGADDV